MSVGQVVTMEQTSTNGRGTALELKSSITTKTVGQSPTLNVTRLLIFLLPIVTTALISSFGGGMERALRNGHSEKMEQLGAVDVPLGRRLIFKGMGLAVGQIYTVGPGTANLISNGGLCMFEK